MHVELLVMSYLIFTCLILFISCFLFYFSSGSDTTKVLVGNKCDLKDKREVNEGDIKVSTLTLEQVAWRSGVGRGLSLLQNQITVLTF